MDIGTVALEKFVLFFLEHHAHFACNDEGQRGYSDVANRDNYSW
jgi:hypothetical protein